MKPKSSMGAVERKEDVERGTHFKYRQSVWCLVSITPGPNRDGEDHRRIDPCSTSANRMDCSCSRKEGDSIPLNGLKGTKR